ncbi:hypothetical protein [Granulicella tundricola]|uniref:Uncharacterized protein n=1 Tax=Granulicella tundricola (strain ATCC BAA-1859 / DSM 23138 / MP5ACTX9) TaxID=1198114 RepID=E8X0V4_GRATM|nr:hypothetical protein [Granulicella tundricola]ADW70138.1 hypothetical protein AciX9_3122 [Granulicella tundricola MP5ACTX9]
MCEIVIIVVAAAYLLPGCTRTAGYGLSLSEIGSVFLGKQNAYPRRANNGRRAVRRVVEHQAKQICAAISVMLFGCTDPDHHLCTCRMTVIIGSARI